MAESNICGCHGRMDRRSFLRFMAAGSAAMAFWPRGSLLAAGEKTSSRRARTKSVILLWMAGGPSQLDTFDPKPGTKTGGAFKAIDTTAKGMRISDQLPRLARVAKHFSIVRTVTTDEAAHARATHLLHTGQEPIKGLEFAPTGTIVAYELGQSGFPLPLFIGLTPPAIPRSHVFGESCLPFVVENVAHPVPNVRSRVGADREKARNSLLAAQNAEFDKGRDVAAVKKARAAERRARDLMTTPLMDAFDVKKEPAKVRERYGHGFGEKCLMARRLVEAGVPFVEVGLGGWDNHVNIFPTMKRNCAPLDQGMSALIDDLHRKGLLDETLVLWMGEFGRTPKINGRKGRDHWTRGFSVVMAGGGIEGGRVVGETDKLGMEIVRRPVPLSDLFTTIYSVLGIDPESGYEVQTRPVVYGGEGLEIKELL